MNDAKQDMAARPLGSGVEREVRPCLLEPDAWELSKDGQPYRLMWHTECRSEIYSWTPLYALEWRPIATAPKDGTRVMTYRAGFAESHAVAWWNDGGCGAAGWVPVHGSSWPEPTHWMPLMRGPNVAGKRQPR